MAMIQKKLSLFENKVFWVLVFSFLAYFFVKWLGLFVAKEFIEFQWRKKTSVDLSIGSLNYSLIRQSVSVQNVRIGAQGEPPFFTLHDITVTVDIPSLFQPQKVIRSLSVSHPHFLVQREGKRSNLTALTSPPKRSSEKRTPATQKTAKAGMLLLKEISVKGLSLSYIEKYRDTSFSYVMDEGTLSMREVAYPRLKKSDVAFSLRFPNRAKALLNGILKSGEDGKPQFTGDFKLDQASIVALKPYMKHHHAIVPKQGTASLASKIELQGTYLKSSHDLKVRDLDIEGEGSAVAAVLGVGSSILSTFLSTTKQEAIELTFNIEGDLTNFQIDWSSLFSRNIAKAFFDHLNLMERSPASTIQESTDKILKGIENLF